MLIRPFQDTDEEAVIALWSRSDLIRPWNDPRKDIARKCRVQRELFLVGTIDGAIVATVMAGYDGHRGWINYLAVEPERRRQGLGRALAVEVERRNLDAIAFYERVGFATDDVVSLGKRLKRDDS